MPLPLQGRFAISQGYGLTAFARSTKGKGFYKNFPGGIHPGIDFDTMGIKIPVSATASGVVDFAAIKGGWGGFVEIMNEDGWNRHYAHLSKIFVKPGDKVEVGQTIGISGGIKGEEGAGSSTGAHLHWGHRRWLALTQRYEYRDPTFELDVKATDPRLPFGLIKVNAFERPEIFFCNGQRKFYVPDLKTLQTLFGDRKWELISSELMLRIPDGPPFPSLE